MESKDERERTERSFDCNNKKINVLLLRNPRELQVKTEQATSNKHQATKQEQDKLINTIAPQKIYLYYVYIHNIMNKKITIYKSFY